jgi:hypothetical protein
MIQNFVGILTTKIKNLKKILVEQNAYSEIYKILSFEKIKIDYNKIIMFTKKYFACAFHLRCPHFYGNITPIFGYLYMG